MLATLLLRMLVFVLVACLLGLIAERHLSLLSALRASHTQAIQLATMDTKTGLLNQRFMQSRLASELSRAERSKIPISFLAIRVNDLKYIQHERGDSVADNVLQAVGQSVQKQLRLSDVSSRWSVDELGVLLYNSDAHGAEIVAGRIAADFAAQPLSDPRSGHALNVSLAQGIATFPTHGKSGKELVDRAFQAMRRAQSDNGVAIWS